MSPEEKAAAQQMCLEQLTALGRVITGLHPRVKFVLIARLEPGQPTGHVSNATKEAACEIMLNVIEQLQVNREAPCRDDIGELLKQVVMEVAKGIGGEKVFLAVRQKTEFLVSSNLDNEDDNKAFLKRLLMVMNARSN